MSHKRIYMEKRAQRSRRTNQARHGSLIYFNTVLDLLVECLIAPYRCTFASSSCGLEILMYFGNNVRKSLGIRDIVVCCFLEIVSPRLI